MKKLILFIIAIIVLISCSRKVTLKGRVLNPVTNQGIEGFTIAVSADTWELPGGAKLVGETTSDANGDFVLEFKKSGYYFSVYKEGYYSIGWYQNGEILPGQLSVGNGKNMKADFYAVPYGKLQINIKNMSCFDSSDKVMIYFDGESDDSWTFNHGLLYEKHGCIDVMDSKVQSTMGYKYFRWVSIKNNITTTYYDTVFVDEGLTTIVNVFY